MVIVELAGLLTSSIRVVGNSISKSFSHAVATNAPNGTLWQKFCGAFFGIQFATTMTATEAREVLGFEAKAKPNIETIRDRLNKMTELNKLEKGGSPYLNDRFLAASHVLAKAK